MQGNDDINIDTIAAQATPPGRGGISILRVSGPEVKNIISILLNRELPPRKACYCTFQDSKGDVIDIGIAIFYSQPNSFTGEDVLEFHGHGSPVVVDMLLQRLLELNVRLAQPGEFSLRAFLNGKMNLTQAEAVADLINAASMQAARGALRSLQGEFSSRIYALNEKIIRLRMYIEAAIDFAEEEINFLSNEKIQQDFANIIEELVTIQSNAHQGSLLREGITIAIMGVPNVGKSSLLNCLCSKDIAIVTEVPGTTRDVIREQILIDDLPIHIFDTAGLRTTADVVEQQGITRAYQAFAQADLILYVIDAASSHSCEEVDDYLNNLTVPIIYVHNKIDLIRMIPQICSEDNRTVVKLSAKTGDGIDLLKQQIKSTLGFSPEMDGFFLARRRHLDALKKAHKELQAGLTQLQCYQHGELAAENLRLAHLALSHITGEFTTDDLLGRIFASFCIGK